MRTGKTILIILLINLTLFAVIVALLMKKQPQRQNRTQSKTYQYSMHFSLAKAAESRGDIESAIRHYTTALSYRKVASTQNKLDSLKRELQAKREADARHLDPAEKERRYRSYVQAGSNHEASKEWEKAIEAYAQALELKPDDSELKSKLATCRHNLYMTLAEEAESKDDLKTAIRLYTTAISYKQVSSVQERLDSLKRKLQTKTATHRVRDEMDTVSYIIGTQIAQNSRKQNIEFDVESLISGLKDALAGRELALSQSEMVKILRSWQLYMKTNQAAEIRGGSTEKTNTDPEASRREYDEMDKISYIVGTQLAQNLKKQDVEVNPEVLISGLKDAFAGNKLSISKTDLQIYQNWQQQMKAKQADEIKKETIEKTKSESEARQLDAAEKEQRFRSYFQAGSNHEAGKEWVKAIEAYAQALKLKPDDSELKSKLATCRHNLYLSLAEKAESKGDLDQAVLMYTTAISNKQVRSTQTKLDSVKKALKERTEAEARRREAAEKERRFQNYVRVGSNHEAGKRWEKAIDAYTQALAIIPDDIKVKDKLATCRHNLYLSHAEEAESRDDIDTAIRMYTTAISHKQVPSTQTKLDSLKKALQAKSEAEDRRIEYTKWLKLAETAEKDGSPTTAIQLYKEARNFVNPEDSESLQAKIDSLRRQLTEQEEKDRVAKTIIDYGSLKVRLNLRLKGTDWVKDACFSPSGEMIASTDKKQVRVWDAATGKCLKILKSNSDMLKAVCFSGDGRLIASGDEYAKIIKIWDLSSGKCLRTIDTGHSKDLFDISFSGDSRFIVSASDDKTLKLWDVESGSLVRTYTGHNAGIFCVSFSPDDKYIASGSWDKTIRLWEVDSGRQLKILKGHTSTVESLAFSPDGDYIAACEWWDNRVLIWDLEGARYLQKKELSGARCVAFSPAGHYTAVGDAYGQVHILNVENGEWVKKFKSYSGFLGVAHLNAVEFSPNGKSVLAAADDKYVKVFKFE